MTPRVPAGTAPGGIGEASAGPQLSRFHIAAIAFQRARQLQSGARPRLDAADHRPARLALLEVMADMIDWTVV